MTSVLPPAITSMGTVSCAMWQGKNTSINRLFIRAASPFTIEEFKLLTVGIQQSLTQGPSVGRGVGRINHIIKKP